MTRTHRFDPTILREYDVRGIVGESLTADDAWALGRAFGTLIARGGGGRAFTAYDGRASSPALEDGVARGLAEAGVAVSRAGLGPTPMLYFAARSRNAEGAIMVTGSHNPPDYNGFKFMLDGQAFFGEDIGGLAKIAADGAFATGAGSTEEHRVFDDYLDALVAAYSGAKPMRVAWDAGNGATGEVLAALTARLPGRHILLNERIDGEFPNHHPDPSVAANLVQLQDTVRAEGCDLGIAFDGDGDRIGVVDGGGRIFWGRPAAGGAGARGIGREPRGHGHRRCQIEPGAVRRDRAPWRPPRDVAHRALPDQEQDGRDGRAHGGRDDRAYFLRRPLLRLR